LRLFIDLEQDADIVAAMTYDGSRKFLVASYQGNGFIVPEEEVLGTTRKGKQVLNLKAPDRAAAMTAVTGELVATIGENRKLLVFPIDQVPEMTKGRGVRLQRYLDKGLSDVTTFEAEKGLTWLDTAGRTFALSLKELKDWRGDRAAAGRIRPHRFLTNNRFGALPAAKASD
jgi:topoisomerase-4 subunit A